MLGGGTLRDDDGHVSGHAEFIPGDGDGDDYEWQPDPEPVYICVNSDQTTSQEDETRVEDVVLAVLAIIVAAEKAAPHVKRWWSDRAAPFLKNTRTELSRSRKLDSRVVVAESSAVAEPEPTESSQEVLVALDEYRHSMSSTEARERFVRTLVARIFSDEQLRILRNARIEDESGALELASAVDTVAVTVRAAPRRPDGRPPTGPLGTVSVTPGA